MKRVLALCFIMTCWSCEKKSTTDDEIYDLLQFVIADQELEKTYGLKVNPEEKTNLDKSDKEFLTDLVIDEPKIDTIKTSGKFELTILTNFEIEHTKCLTQDDVDFMLNQQFENKTFKWDNSRLGFDLNNNKNWYVLSVPLFSKDKKKAVMMIRHLCEGLCGTGWTLVLTNENGKWTSEKGMSWIH